jgi:hypothetical protein
LEVSGAIFGLKSNYSGEGKVVLFYTMKGIEV